MDFCLIDKQRKEHGFMTTSDIINDVCPTNTVLDPFSLLISKDAKIGEKNIFFPNVTIYQDSASYIEIGENNIFSSGIHIHAQNGGKVIIGQSNEFNDGPICIKSNTSSSHIEIKNNVRLDGKINLYGSCYFGDGSQILGTINVYSCTLEDGDSYKEPDPETRAGLLKGIGTARNISVAQGMVINGFGEFLQDSSEPQSNYHK